MLTEDCSGNRRRDGLRQGAPHDGCFAFARNEGDQLRHPEDRRDGQRYGALRHLFNRVEPFFGDLLTAARRVECYHLHVHGIGKVRLRRLVKGEMTVFPNAQQAQRG